MKDRNWNRKRNQKRNWKWNARGVCLWRRGACIEVYRLIDSIGCRLFRLIDCCSIALRCNPTKYWINLSARAWASSDWQTRTRTRTASPYTPLSPHPPYNNLANTGSCCKQLVTLCVVQRFVVFLFRYAKVNIRCDPLQTDALRCDNFTMHLHCISYVGRTRGLGDTADTICYDISQI